MVLSVTLEVEEMSMGPEKLKGGDSMAKRMKHIHSCIPKLH